MSYIEAAEAPDRNTGRVRLYGPDAFEGMRRAGRLAASCLDMIAPHVKPGVTTDALDQLCDSFIRDHGGVSAPLSYKGFPKSICTSVNTTRRS